MDASLASISPLDAQPFASPKVSHASQIGSAECVAKYANPHTALFGALSLKMNGEN
jgi:hypothetical protein